MNPTAAAWAFAELKQPGVVGVQSSHPAYTPALTTATLIGVFAGPDPFEEAAIEASSRIVGMQAAGEGLAASLRQLLVRCEEEWKEKIETLVARAALEAPKEYWEGRRKLHADGLRRSRRVWVIGICLFLASLVGLLVLPSYYPDLFFPRISDPQAAVIQGAYRLLVFGSFFGIAIWGLRQQLRDVRSHEHLAEDAAERVTMIETYSALREAKMQPADLTPILAALYRPATTGIIDDSGPATPLEVVMRTVEKAASKG